MLKKIIGDRFRLIYIKASAEEVRHRDVKGLYKSNKNNMNKSLNLSEEPSDPDLIIDTTNRSVKYSANILFNFYNKPTNIIFITEMNKCNLTQLEELEAESIHVLRETLAQFSSASLLFSGGKDSLVCLHLIAKASYPANSPFVALHVDTAHNFPMVMKFRDEVLEKYKMKLFDRKVEDAIKEGLVQDETVVGATFNELQIPVLLEAIEHHKFDACIGGARRAKKSKSKRKIFSHRDDFGQW